MTIELEQSLRDTVGALWDVVGRQRKEITRLERELAAARRSEEVRRKVKTT
jgi:hypothetical protein